MGKIVVDRGLEKFTIEDKKGTVLGEFEMNPSDMELVKRYEQVADAISHVSDGIEKEEDIAIALVKIENKVKEQINYLFNADVADNFFSITSPFTLLANGDFFIENVLNAIGELIKAETGKKFKKIQTKVNKYAVKYHG